MKALLCVVAMAVLVGTAVAHEDDGRPFGPISDADMERFAEFAKKQGFDVLPEMEQIFLGEDDALGRLFRLSTSLTSLDAHGRAYGQLVYSTFLNLGEKRGADFFLKTLDRQPRDVQQRVRDFLYYPASKLSEEQQRAERGSLVKEFPTLFPQGYEFGRNDPVFSKTEAK